MGFPRAYRQQNQSEIRSAFSVNTARERKKTVRENLKKPTATRTYRRFAIEFPRLGHLRCYTDTEELIPISHGDMLRQDLERLKAESEKTFADKKALAKEDLAKEDLAAANVARPSWHIAGGEPPDVIGFADEVADDGNPQAAKSKQAKQRARKKERERFAKPKAAPLAPPKKAGAYVAPADLHKSSSAVQEAWLKSSSSGSRS